MQIQELERRTGLDRATIRFYEKEALILPQRSENGYRQYSDTDAEHLMKIKLLRQLGMSLEQIRSLQQGSGEIAPLLDSHILVLNSQIQSKQQAAEVCLELKKDGATYGSLDAEHYLRLLREGIPSGSGTIPEPKPLPFREPVRREVHPLRRYAARMLDINIFVTFVYVFFFLVLRLRPVPTGIAGSLISAGLWLVWLPLEALFLSLWRTTPGKWIMGIRLESCEGGKLRFSQALDRAWRVFGRGLGYTIPIWNLWRLYKSYRNHVESADTEWDDQTEVIYSSWEGKGKSLLAGAAALILAMNIWLSMDSYLPRYRTDELTVAQFAENFNFYQTTTYGTGETGYRLAEDGRRAENQTQTAVIRFDGVPEDLNRDFEYETEDGYIRRITYTNRWTTVYATSTVPEHCRVAALTVVCSQPEFRYEQFAEFMELWELQIQREDGLIDFCGVTIRWDTETENLKLIGDVYAAADGELPGSLTIDFEILIENP